MLAKPALSLFNNPRWVLRLLRLSIASVFLYAAAAATLQPDNWIGYIPPLARGVLPAESFLTYFSLFQFILSIWVLSGWKTFYAAIIATLVLIVIMVANVNQMDILFRDLAILFAALALILSTYHNHI